MASGAHQKIMGHLIRKNPAIILSDDKTRVAIAANGVDQRLGAITDAQLLDTPAGKAWIMPYTVPNFVAAHKLGIPLESPIRHRYDWKGRFTPMDHQRTTAAFCTLFDKMFILNGLGLGKTLSVLWAADYLMNEKIIHKVLVLSTLSTLMPVWGVEIFQHLPHRRYTILHGAGKKMLDERADFLVMNHDGLRDGALLAKIIGDPTIDLVIVDECALLRNARTRKYKALYQLTRAVPRVWMLTATPTPNSPTDAWAQARIVNPVGVPRFFRDFQNIVMTKQGMYRWTPKSEAPVVVHRVMQPAIRFTPEECLDLPPITHMTRFAPMTDEQINAYETMRKTLVAEVNGNQITAANEAVKTNKMLQIACGVLYDDGQSYAITARRKIDILFELIEECDGPVIVFAPFKFIVGSLMKHAGQIRVNAEKIDGETSRGARDRIFERFQKGEIKVIIAHPQTMSHGLTLTKSATMIWYAPIWSNDIYEQAIGRIYRKGQTRHVNIIHLESCPVETEMYRRLRDKQMMQGLLLSMFSGTAMVDNR